MKWSYVKFLVFLTAFNLTPLYGAEKFLLNPAPDEDYLIKINDGGVIKDLLRADASANKVIIDGDLEATGTTTGFTATSAAPDWLTGTPYGLDEVVVDPNSGMLYRAASAHTSTGTNLTDDVGKYQVIGSASSGVQVSGWVSYTPGSNGFTVTSPNVEYRRVGDTFHIRADFTMASASASEWQIDLPPGLTMATPGNNTAQEPCGSLNRDITSTVGYRQTILCAHNATAFRLARRDGSNNLNSFSSTNADNIGNNHVIFDAYVEIQEWNNSGTTVSLFDLTEKTKFLTNSEFGATLGSALSTSTLDEVFGYGLKDSAGVYWFIGTAKITLLAPITAPGGTLIIPGTVGKLNIRQAAVADPHSSEMYCSVGTTDGNGGTPSGSFLDIGCRNVGGGTTNKLYLSWDVELESKPSWFDANRENPASVSAFVSLNDEPTLNAVYMTATTATGTPAAGKFYSEIVGREPMLDLSKIPSGKHGVERVVFRSLPEVTGESGASGEIIQSTGDSLGRFRFIDEWTQEPSGGNGPFDWGRSGLGGKVEITFYGTGLNLVAFQNAFNRTYDVYLDGVAQPSISVTGSDVISNRNYAPRIVYPVIAGQTLGVHTVTLENTSTNGRLYGFEILNEATTVAIPSGSIVYKGKRFITPATTDDLTTFENEYQDGAASGAKTVGGHQVRYFDVDGTIKKDINYADSTQLNLGAASHANSEVVQKFNWRQFGAGRSDDFSTLVSQSDRAFTLDDGTTTLVGNDITLDGNRSTVTFTATGSFLTLTFVGTGLDIVRHDSATTGGGTPFSVEVNGVSIGNLSGDGVDVSRTEAIVSGLPFGTHTMKLNRPSGVTFALGVHDFIIYAPKKPVLADGQVEIDSTYKVADFVVETASLSPSDASIGVIRKVPTREMIYSGLWTISSANNPTRIGGNQFSTTGSADVSYTFFGTGFDFRGPGQGGADTQSAVTLDDGSGFQTLTNSGPGNFPTAVIGVIGDGGTAYDTQTGASISATGNAFNQAAGATGIGLNVSGLPLGKYTVKFARVSGIMYGGAFDIITPTYSYKNNLLNLDDALVGSNTLKNEILVPGATKHKIIATEGIEFDLLNDLAEDQNFQTKCLTASVTSGVGAGNTSAEATEIAFTNLEVGATYEYSFNWTGSATNAAAFVIVNWAINDNVVTNFDHSDSQSFSLHTSTSGQTQWQGHLSNQFVSRGWLRTYVGSSLGSAPSLNKTANTNTVTIPGVSNGSTQNFCQTRMSVRKISD